MWTQFLFNLNTLRPMKYFLKRKKIWIFSSFDLVTSQSVNLGHTGWPKKSLCFKSAANIKSLVEIFAIFFFLNLHTDNLFFTNIILKSIKKLQWSECTKSGMSLRDSLESLGAQCFESKKPASLVVWNNFQLFCKLPFQSM